MDQLGEPGRPAGDQRSARWARSSPACPLASTSPGTPDLHDRPVHSTATESVNRYRRHRHVVGNGRGASGGDAELRRAVSARVDGPWKSIHLRAGVVELRHQLQLVRRIHPATVDPVALDVELPVIRDRTAPRSWGRWRSRSRRRPGFRGARAATGRSPVVARHQEELRRGRRERQQELASKMFCATFALSSRELRSPCGWNPGSLRWLYPR